MTVARARGFACESRDHELKSRAVHLLCPLLEIHFNNTIDHLPQNHRHQRSQSDHFRDHKHQQQTMSKSEYKAANMIAGWDDLAYNENYERYGEFNELKAWLRSQTQESQTIITPTSHHLDLLRTALQAAIYEIRDNLDDQSKSAPPQ